MKLSVTIDLVRKHGSSASRPYHNSLYIYSPDDTIGDLKKLVAAQTGTKSEKIILKKWYTVYKDHITLEDCMFDLCAVPHQ